MVLAGRGGTAANWTGLDDFVTRAGFEVVPFDAVQAEAARQAFLIHGKGRHPAGLNMGDCVSYALAQVHGLPLLFKGSDFPRTDVMTPA